MYDVASNLGSLFVRILFQPIEEISNTIWSKFLNQKDKNMEDEKFSLKIFNVLFKFVIIMGTIILFFGPNYSNSLINILYGDKWKATETSKLLSYYCVYVFFLGINGITESFVQAVSNNEEILVFNYFMIGITIVYLSFLYFFLNVLKLGIYKIVKLNLKKNKRDKKFDIWKCDKLYNENNLFNVFHQKILSKK
jgi:oligosaccharide translocation protein RFT1